MEFLTEVIQNIHWGYILYFFNFIIAIIIVFLERRDSSATLLWLAILVLLPIAGFVLYMFLSQNLARRKIFRLTEREEYLLSNSLKNQIKDIADNRFDFKNSAAKEWRELIHLNQAYGKAYYTSDNSVELFTDGHDLMASMLKDIAEAKESIHVLFFIVKNDNVGQVLLDALTKKAREGVKVRFLVDALGSRHIGKHATAEFVEAGGEFARFLPPRIPGFGLTYNYRNHRKLVAIDDCIGYIGGFNIAKEYLGQKKKFGYWRDTHLRILGAGVQDINGRFLLDWRQATGNRSPVDMARFYQEFEEPVGNCGMQIVSAGPDTRHEEIKRAMLKMITSAKKSIHIQTPYFVPDASILEGLKMAAQSGVEVNIMIPCMPDHIFVYWATYSYVGEIISSGGHVYIYDNGFMHSKVLVVDGQVCTVGSTNFDRRSFRLNFECNAFIYDVKTSNKLIAAFEEDLKRSHELTPAAYAARSRWIRIKEPISRLLSDLL